MNDALLGRLTVTVVELPVFVTAVTEAVLEAEVPAGNWLFVLLTAMPTKMLPVVTPVGPMANVMVLLLLMLTLAVGLVVMSPHTQVPSPFTTLVSCTPLLIILLSRGKPIAR